LITSTEASKMELLWGAAAIADELGIDSRKAFYLLEKGSLPAKKVQGRWVADRGKLRAFFTEEAA
jgi:hypothetical protein